MERTILISRTAELNDVEKLDRLHYLSHTRSFQDFAAGEWIERRRFVDYQNFWNSFISRLEDREITWTTWLGDQLVGTVTVKQLGNSSEIFYPRAVQGWDSGRICCLRLMYVHPDFLRRGIGGELMGFARTFMEKTGYRLGTLITHAANRRARAFYEDQGWRLDEVFREQVKEFFEEPEEMRARARYYLPFEKTDQNGSHSAPIGISGD